MKKLRLLSIALVILFLGGCSPDDSTNNPGNNVTDEEFRENFGSQVNRDFIGQIVDIDNHGIQGATVKIGSTSVQTDQNGVFIINGATVYQKFAYITATKAGYIDGSRSMIPTSGKNNVKIMLLQSGALETIQSGEESEVSIYSGTKVRFDGAFEDENGVPYSGNVDVFMFHLTPSDENLSSLQPGMLYAETESGEEAVLQTFGMMNVELRGSGGQKLQIADGHKAEISMRIDDNQLASAPAEIPLWHFDENAGWWKEEGSATKQGNYYVGKVSHFSWWNVDWPMPLVNLTIHVVDTHQVSLPNVLVKLEAIFPNGSQVSASNTTDTNGLVSGLVPASTQITVNLYGSCGEIVYSEVVGPFSSDTVLPDITLPDANTSLIEGNLLTCEGVAVTNGYVSVSLGNFSNIVAVIDGTFSTSLIYCGDTDTFTVSGYDFGQMQSSGALQYTLSGNNDIGDIYACGSLSEYISYAFDGQQTIITEGITARIIGSGPVSGLRIYDSGQNINLYGNTNIPGNYDQENYNLKIEGYDVTIASTDAIDMTYNLGAFGAVGQYIDITFSGTFTDSDGNPHTVAGIAHVLRDQ